MRLFGKPEWLWSTSIIALALPILYVLSLGPALWLNERKVLHYDVLVTVWKPLVHGHGHISEGMQRYGNLWITRQHRDNLRLERLARLSLMDTEEQARQQLTRRFAGHERD